MKLSISYRHVESHDSIESETSRSVEKLERLLKTYDPDLIQLHGVFSKNPHDNNYAFSLNLSLPTGGLHSTGEGKNILAASKKAFSELESQVKKHQSRLRHDHEWKRKRPHPRLAESV